MTVDVKITFRDPSRPCETVLADDGRGHLEKDATVLAFYHGTNYGVIERWAFPIAEIDHTEPPSM